MDEVGVQLEEDGLTNVVIHGNLDIPPPPCLLLYRLSVKDCRSYIVMCCFVSTFVKLIGNSPKPNKNFVGDL